MPTYQKIFKMLSPQRRLELEEEILVKLLRDTFRKHYRGTFKELVDALAKSPHWTKLRRVKVSSVLKPRGK